MSQTTSDPNTNKPAAHPAPLTIDSTALFQGAREVHITHEDTHYRLTITRLNKLILTK